MAGYRDLIFDQKSQELVIGINQLIKSWPNTMQTQVLSRQLFRAATSVGVNIAEGYGRYTGSEYIDYLTISRGSANEVDHWLHAVIDCKLGDRDQCLRLIDINTENRKMLYATIQTLKERRDNPSVQESPSPYTLSPYALEDTDL
jgi:four helix bundle protein